MVGVLGDAVLSARPVVGLQAITVEVAADQADAALSTLAGTEGVRYAERSALLGADGEILPAVLPPVEVPQAWTWSRGDAGVTVAVVDSGVSPNLDLKASRLTAGRDFVDGDEDPADDDGHGTMMANFIAAQSGNNVGTIGVCGVCQIMPVRVLKNGQGTTADAAAGIAWAADHGAQVINFSASTASPSQLLQDAVEHAHAKGALLIASAGNEASTRRRYPAAFEPALAVTEDDPYHYFPEKNTSTRQWVDINAWGQASVLSKDGQVVLTQGSSVATAVVSGIAALAFAMKPDATATEVNALIRRAADRQPASPAYRTPTVNAAQVMYDLGGTDTNPPAIYKTDLTDNQLVSSRRRLRSPHRHRRSRHRAHRPGHRRSRRRHRAAAACQREQHRTRTRARRLQRAVAGDRRGL
nr:hypothetical protein GCM10020092_001360 [Actinoplanes digitatis]